ncbi:MAG: type II toxin-antitoxin system RelE/ParE family toxin [Thermodesulfovibrionales bacterium]|nr:type II toxin-antitoxin system RelE/ParE family toxin [Thermodesulfovibrionales bacterium]
MFKILIKKSAQKEMDNLPIKLFKKIDNAIMQLKEEPFPFPQSKNLRGEDLRRLKVGDYRVIYTVDEKQKIITIFKIRHRKEVYR